MSAILLLLQAGRVDPGRAADAVAPITPSLTLVISAYNEAAVIRKKIENALALDYPAEALEIVVISDASDDGTDDIVKEYASQGVRLFRQAERRGKTAGLNPHRSDAPRRDRGVLRRQRDVRDDALRKLVRNFADPTCRLRHGRGAVSADGDDARPTSANGCTGTTRCRSSVSRRQLGSMVGGDGAIYAIRRSLWQTLPENAINDFLNPLQIVAAGWRGVYEPEAVCFEETAGGMRTEYRRRVRIVSRSWRAVFQAPWRAQPVPSRPVRMVAAVSQGAAMALGAVRGARRTLGSGDCLWT